MSSCQQRERCPPVKSTSVALTRAKRGLFIVGDRELLETHFVWYELIKYLNGSIMKPDDYFNLINNQ